MNLKYIKHFALAFILALTFPVTAFAATTGAQISADGNGVKATIAFEKEKIATGKNNFTLTFTDADGNPVAVDNLQVTADMDRSDMGNDGMKSEDPMMLDLINSQTGVYTGQVDLSNEGKWIMNASFDLQGQNQSLDLNFDVMNAASGPNWIVLGVFGGVVAVILIVALISKKTKKA